MEEKKSPKLKPSAIALNHQKKNKTTNLQHLQSPRLSCSQTKSYSPLKKQGQPTSKTRQSVSRNRHQQKPTEDSTSLYTKTVHISLGSLNQSPSLNSLHTQNKNFIQSKNEIQIKDNHKRLTGSFSKQTSNLRSYNEQTNDPPIIVCYVDSLNPQQTSQKEKLRETSKSNKSLEKVSESSVTNHQMNNHHLNSAQEFTKNQSATKVPQKSKPLYQPILKQAQNIGRPSLTSNQALNSIQKNSKPSYTGKAKTETKPPRVVKTKKSPRPAESYTSAGTSSMYSVTNDSAYSNTQSVGSGGLRERKPAISDKQASKSKSKRTNANKQPKQISITREQLAIPKSASTQSSKQQQIMQNAQCLPLKENNCNTKMKRNDSQSNTDYKTRGNEQLINRQSNEPTPRLLFQYEDRGSPYQAFSFQGTSQKAKQSIYEEEKGSGCFIDTLGNENRPSLGDNSAEKRFQEIPTPVFSARNDRKHTDIGIFGQGTIKLDQRDKSEDLKDLQNQELEVIKQVSQDYQTQNIESIFHSKVMRSLQGEKTLKKVHSTNDLGLKKAQSYNSVQILQPIKHNRNASKESFLSRIKNYFNKVEVQENRQQPLYERVYYLCNCGSSGKPYACARAIKWLEYSNNYSEMEYDKNRKLYENLVSANINSGSETQIQRDIPRTFANVDSFMNSKEGQQRLSRVLNAFSQYFSSIGYVQGMNFIVGSLLLHCSEDIAFWLFVSLIEDYEMRDIYEPKLPGLYKHSQVIQLLQMEHLKDLYYYFCDHNITIEMYASDWIFALFSNIIPLTEYHHFLDQFFVEGWNFFYKFSLTFLKSLQNDVMECQDISEILTMIKLKYTKKSFAQQQNEIAQNQDSDIESLKLHSEATSASPQKNFEQMKTMFQRIITGRNESLNSESFKNDSVWEKVVKLSIKEWQNEFNENFVQQLLASFDPEKMVFKQSMPTSPRRTSIASSSFKNSTQQVNESLVSNEQSLQYEDQARFLSGNDQTQSKYKLELTEKTIQYPKQNKLLHPELAKVYDQKQNSTKARQ